MAQILPSTLNMAISLSAMRNRDPAPGRICSKPVTSLKSAIVVACRIKRGTPDSTITPKVKSLLMCREGPYQLWTAMPVLAACSHRDRSVQLFLPFAGVDVPTPALGSRMKHSVCFMHDEPHVARAAVRRQAKVGEGFCC